MAFWIPMLIGAGLGAAKNVESQAMSKAERKRQGEIHKWSPWTGLQGQTVKGPGSFIGDVAVGAAAGSQFGKMFPSDGSSSYDSVLNQESTSSSPSFEMGSEYEDFMRQNPNQNLMWRSMMTRRPTLYGG